MVSSSAILRSLQFYNFCVGGEEVRKFEESPSPRYTKEHHVSAR